MLLTLTVQRLSPQGGCITRPHAMRLVHLHQATTVPVVFPLACHVMSRNKPPVIPSTMLTIHSPAADEVAGEKRIFRLPSSSARILSLTLARTVQRQPPNQIASPICEFPSLLAERGLVGAPL